MVAIIGYYISLTIFSVSYYTHSYQNQMLKREKRKKKRRDAAIMAAVSSATMGGGAC